MVLAVLVCPSVSAPTVEISGTSSAVFTAPVPASAVVSGVGTNSFTWGEAYPTVSQLRFTGTAFDVPVATGVAFGTRPTSERKVFSLGNLWYYNGTIRGGTGAGGVQLTTTMQVTAPVGTDSPTLGFPLTLVNTPNTQDPIASADYVYLPTTFAPVTFKTAGGFPLTLDLVGFGTVSGAGFNTIDRFFVLEGGSASADMLGKFVPPSESIVDGAVSVWASGATIGASFTPNFSLTLEEASKLAGYNHFNWYQQITTDPYPPGGQTVPYVDPPSGGGAAFGGYADTKPFYWDEEGATGTGYHLNNHTSTYTLDYSDTPAESRLKTGEYLGFVTSLAGVNADGTWDNLYTFRWTSDFNGTTGGVSIHRNTTPPDPGSGTGNVSILQLNLNPEDLSATERAQMVADGARNVPLGDLSVPEPASIAVWGFLGLALCLGAYWRRRRSG